MAEPFTHTHTHTHAYIHALIFILEMFSEVIKNMYALLSMEMAAWPHEKGRIQPLAGAWKGIEQGHGKVRENISL